jgi:hypothetical protein
MKKSKFTEERIAYALRQVEGGVVHVELDVAADGKESRSFDGIQRQVRVLSRRSDEVLCTTVTAPVGAPRAPSRAAREPSERERSLGSRQLTGQARRLSSPLRSARRPLRLRRGTRASTRRYLTTSVTVTALLNRPAVLFAL